jgi:hypothetical protein
MTLGIGSGLPAYTGPASSGSAASSPSPSAGAAGGAGGANAVSNFLAYADMTPAQRMQADILKSMGLTQDDLNKMSPDKRKAVEATIQERLKEATLRAAQNGKTGQLADITA